MDYVKDDEWGLFPNFKKSEFVCHHTGLCLMTHKMMYTLQDIRKEYGKPMTISSGYRDVSHPVERSKTQPGEHSLGLAVDVLVHGYDAALLTMIAVEKGIKRIGVSQKGDFSERFLHLGMGDAVDPRFPVSMWSY